MANKNFLKSFFSAFRTKKSDKQTVTLIEKVIPKSSEQKLQHGEKQNVQQAIECVKKKVPVWFSQPSQKNAKTLIQYMKLSNGGTSPVFENDMIESGFPIPRSMRQATQGADGFIFDYKKKKGYIKLWKHIRPFIIEEWNKHPELH